MLKIGDNPKIKLLKKKARQRSLLENLENELATGVELDDLIDGETFDYALEDKKDIRHLKGKYERYRLHPSRNFLFKDILTIQPDGKVVIRAFKNIYTGVASYVLNTTLQINVSMQNEDTPFPLNLLMFVGRNDKEDIQCLYAICLTTNADNQPSVHYELLVPIPKQETTALPQRIVVDSLEFFKLTHKYPNLMKYLQQRELTIPNRVVW
jgi:hypothetical protein